MVDIESLLSADERALVGRYEDPERARIGFGQRPALLVVDVTNAFADERFSAYCGPGAATAVQAIGRLLAGARAAGVPVAYSHGHDWPTQAERGHWKSRTGGDRGVATGLPPAYDIVAAVAPRPGEPVVTKSKPSAFFGTHLSSVLTHLRVDTVIVVGMATSGCVRATVVDAFSLGFRVVVPKEAVADRIAVSHACTLFDVGLKYADVLTTAEVLDHLSSSAP